MSEPSAFDPAAVSDETREFNQRLEEALAAVPPTHQVPVEATRAARARGEGVFPPGGPLPSADWREIPGAQGGPGRVRLSPPEGAPAGLVLHFHGGGWALNAPELYDEWCRHLAQEAGVAVASAAYRLAPENPWPACADDAEAAALWALDGAAEFGGGLVIAGESAGAHLVAVALGRLKRRGLARRVAGALLHYGCYDLRMTPSMANWGARQLILSTPTVQWFIDNLTPDPSARTDPDVSPLLGDLAGLPPALFQVGSADPLLDDTLFMAARWRAAGNAAELNVYPGGVHAFDMFDLALAREARAAAVAFVNRRCAEDKGVSSLA